MTRCFSQYAGLVFSLLGLAAACAPPAVHADELKPSWACVPEQTVLVVRVPGGNDFFETLKKNTRLGRVMLSDERFQDFAKALAQIGGAKQRQGWEEFQKVLAAYDLKLDDLRSLFAHEMGAAAVVRTVGEKLEAYMLGWLEPGGDLSERLLAALDKVTDEIRGEPDAPERTDLEIEGQKAIYLSIPINDYVPASLPGRRKAGGALENDPADDDDGQLLGAPAAIEKRQVGLVHLIVTKLERRLLFAATFSRPEAKEDGKDQAVQLATPEALQEHLGRFIAAHRSDDPAEFALYDTPGLSAALPAGAPLAEFVGNPQPLLKAIAKLSGKEASETMRFLGLDRLGAFAYRQSFDSGLLRSGLFISMPAPRSGVLSLADPYVRPAEVPAWVPSEPISYSQLNFDLGKALAQIREMVVGQNPAAAESFNSIDNVLKAALQTTAVELLSSIGSAHAVLSFAPKGQRGTTAQELFGASMYRMAFVWQVSDENLWNRILQLVAQSTQQKIAEEQGFRGIRFDLKQVGLEGGFFLGNGHLVFGLGKGVVETVLAALRNPPVGEAAFVGTKTYARASELAPPEPCLQFTIGDGERYLKSVATTFRQLLSATAEEADVDPIGQAIAEAFGKLVPSDKELEGVLGVSVGRMTLDDHGLRGATMLELPPPEER